MSGVTVQQATGPRVIVALDYPDAASALALADRLDPSRCRVKVGKELFTRGGPALVEQLIGKGFDLFLDLKYHDIPNTVAGACRAAADLGVWMVNVHALGGRRMMEAAREAVAHAERPPILLAVTILTSLGEGDLREIGLEDSAGDSVVRLARLAHRSGMDGVVCSPREVRLLRRNLNQAFCLVTPGIRPVGAGADDQVRVMTPGDAILSGSDYLVIGRPVTAVADPLAALDAITAEVDQALVRRHGDDAAASE